MAAWMRARGYTAHGWPVVEGGSGQAPAAEPAPAEAEAAPAAPPAAPAAPPAAEQAPAKAPPAQAGERRAEPTKARAKAPAKASAPQKGSIVVQPAGEPLAETLLAGLQHTDSQVGREGLRAIVKRIMDARKQVEKGFNPEKFPQEYSRHALDAAYQEWEAWLRAMSPLPEAEGAKISAALDIITKENEALDAALKAWAKREAQAAAKEAGADPETGEILQYEAPQGEAA